MLYRRYVGIQLMESMGLTSALLELNNSFRLVVRGCVLWPSISYHCSAQDRSPSGMPLV